MKVTLEIVPMRQFFGAGAGRGNLLVPNTPALYFWTRDFCRFAKSWTLEGDLATQLHDITSARGRRFAGRIEPYYEASVRDLPAPLSVEKTREILASLNTEVAEWLWSCCTVLQRPLYVGKTCNLQDRVRAHTSPGSRFRQYLKEVEIDIIDCSLVYSVCLAMPNLSDVQEDEEEPEVFPALDLLEALATRLAMPSLARKMEFGL